VAASDPVAVIEATLSPAFLITGASIFLNFTQARLFRVVDRARAAAEEQGEGEEPAALRRRARLLRNAIALGVLTVALTVVTALLLMAGALSGVEGVSSAAPVAFAGGMLALFAALCFALWDTVLSVRTVTRAR
jgi:hypothetical protein